MPDRLTDRGVLLDDSGGVLERHRPAAELRELRAERLVALMQRRSACPRSCLGTYLLVWPCALVHAAQRQPGQDPLRRGGGRPGVHVQGSDGRRGRRGRGQGLRPQAAPAAGDAGRHGQVRRGRSGCRAATPRTPASSSSWGSASRSEAAACRPRPYAARPAPPPAQSPTPRRSRSPSRPARPSSSGPWSRATPWAATPTRRTRRRTTTTRRRTPARSWCSVPGARRGGDAAPCVDEAQVVAEAVAGARDWVNTPPGDFTPAGVRRRRRRARRRRPPRAAARARSVPR